MIVLGNRKLFIINAYSIGYYLQQSFIKNGTQIIIEEEETKRSKSRSTGRSERRIDARAKNGCTCLAKAIASPKA